MFTKKAATKIGSGVAAGGLDVRYRCATSMKEAALFYQIGGAGCDKKVPLVSGWDSANAARRTPQCPIKSN